MASISKAIKRILTTMFHKELSVHELAAIAPALARFPDPLLIVDSFLMITQKPKACFQSSNLFFSGKNYNYGLKYQLFHSRDYTAVHISGPHLGGKSDLVNLEEESETIRKFLENKNVV